MLNINPLTIYASQLKLYFVPGVFCWAEFLIFIIIRLNLNGSEFDVLLRYSPCQSSTNVLPHSLLVCL